MPALTRFANMVIVTVGCLAACFALYLLHRHGWSRTYVVLLGSAGLLFAGLRLASTVKISLSLLIATMFISLYGVEALLRTLLSPGLTWEDIHDQTRGLAWSRDQIDDRAQRAIQGGQSFDARDRLQVIKDIEAHGLTAYPPIAGNAYIEYEGTQILPLAGISQTTTVYCNELGQYTIYQSDEHGFHNPPELWSHQPVEIAVIGDSFVHGACVPSEKNFAALIRSHVPRTLNLGMGGIGPLHELAILKEYGSVMRPNVVLWVYYEGNDLADLSHEKNGFFRAYLTRGPFQGLISKQAGIDAGLIGTIRQVRQEVEQAKVQENFPDQIEQFMKVDALRKRFGLLFARVTSSELDDTLDVLTSVLQEAVALTGTWGGRVVFVYLPHYGRYTNTWLADMDREQVLVRVHRLNLDVIDLSPVFAAQSDPLKLFPFRSPGHYTVEGNQLVAEHILSGLSKLSQARAVPVSSSDPARLGRRSDP
ncbi:MAG: hypothetical protein OJF47_004231 [Nitrospira sp.]|jgi:hypothetical protein|nr:MAG: hypothetical protein OJF47_004231 [Nitrospira sp.]